MLMVLLLAYALRAYHLDYQSLWSDEGISLLRASLSLPEMLAEMPREHMPGYFVLLHGWLRLAGESDFSLRFPSLLASVLSVALIFRLGADLNKVVPAANSATAGAVAAVLLATSAFQVWYAQEARMYSWLLAMALLSTWALWRLLVRPGRQPAPWLVVYAVTTAACVYLHLYGALVPIAQTVFVAGWAIVQRDVRSLVRWAGASAVAFLLFLPWLPRALAIFGFEGWREGGNASEIPWRYLAAYSVSDGMPAPWHGWLPWLYALLALAGIWFWRRVRPAAAWLLVAGVLVPMTIVFAFALRNPDYHERYAIMVTGPLLLLVAGGVRLIGPDSPTQHPGSRRGLTIAAALALTAALAAANLVAVERLYNDVALQKPDFRGAAGRIMGELQPGDVVLVDGPDPEKVFLHYYSAGAGGTGPVYAVGELEQATLDAADAELTRRLQDASRVWELLYFHNPATVQVWLATRGWATDPTYHNGIRVTLYGLNDGRAISRSLGVAFGTELTLEAAEVNTVTPQPGELLRVTTRWFTQAPAPEYKFSLRLHDAAGTIAQSVDYVPQNWLAPTNVWLVDQPASDQRGLVLRPDLPPGQYRLTLRLYDPGTGAAVETALGQDVLLAELEIG